MKSFVGVKIGVCSCHLLSSRGAGGSGLVSEVAGDLFGAWQDDGSEVSDVAGEDFPVGETVGPPGGF